MTYFQTLIAFLVLCSGFLCLWKAGDEDDPKSKKILRNTGVAIIITDLILACIQTAILLAG